MVTESKYFNFNANAVKTVFICLGNRDRADDGVGIEIGRELKKKTELKVYTEEDDDLDTALLEALEDPDIEKIVFIDAADFDSIPGTFIVTPTLSDKIRILSTHSFPINHWEELIKQHNKQMVFIGIQVSNVNFMGEVTEGVKKAKEKVLQLINPFNEQ